MKEKNLSSQINSYHFAILEEQEGNFFCNPFLLNKPFLHIQMSGSLHSAGCTRSGTEHSHFLRGLKDAHPHGSGACHFLSVANPLQVLTKLKIDVPCKHRVKQTGLDPWVMLSL